MIWNTNNLRQLERVNYTIEESQMSRTIRHKGAEKRLRVNGSKIAGYYTEYDLFLACPKRHGGCNYYIVYREPTKAEWYKKYRHLHLDHNGVGGANTRKQMLFNTKTRITTCGKNFEEKSYRHKCKRVISNYMHGKCEDVIVDTGPKRNPKWWWD